MSVLGPINTGNFGLDGLLTLIDERLTELYSIQGKMSEREVPSFPSIDIRDNAVTGVTPEENRFYTNSFCKAWACTITTGSISASFNLQLDSFDGTNQYVYSFRRPLADDDYAVLVTVSQASSGTTTQNATITDKTQFGFTVVTNVIQDNAGGDVISNFQAEHYVAVFGNT